MKLYYWRHSHAAHNTNTLHVVFTNRENRDGISATVKPNDDGTWRWFFVSPGSRHLYGDLPTQEEAQTKVEQLINREFQPEYIPYFG